MYRYTCMHIYTCLHTTHTNTRKRMHLYMYMHAVKKLRIYTTCVLKHISWVSNIMLQPQPQQVKLMTVHFMYTLCVFEMWLACTMRMHTHIYVYILSIYLPYTAKLSRGKTFAVFAVF